VGFLDFVCVHVLTEQERYCWFLMIRAAICGHNTDLREFMGQAGFLDADPSLTAEELYLWGAELLNDIHAEPQPVIYTVHNRSRVTAGMFDF